MFSLVEKLKCFLFINLIKLAIDVTFFFSFSPKKLIFRLEIKKNPDVMQVGSLVGSPR